MKTLSPAPVKYPVEIYILPPSAPLRWIGVTRPTSRKDV